MWTGPKPGAVRGGEDGRVGGDGVGHAFAAGEPGSDDLPGVVLVHLRASRADVFAAVAARDAQDTAGFGRGVVHDRGLAGALVDGVDAAFQPDRMGTVPGGGKLGFPAMEVVAGRQVQGVVDGRKVEEGRPRACTPVKRPDSPPSLFPSVFSRNA